MLYRTRQSGNTTTEHMLIISVIVVALVGVAAAFLPSFSLGLQGLADDVYALLTGEERPGTPDQGGGPGGDGWGGEPGGGGWGGGGWGGGGYPGGGSGDDDDGDDNPPSDEEPPSDDEGDSEPEDGEDDEEDDAECPYVYDEASDRWRDPETGQYVSFEEAESAGCST